MTPPLVLSTRQARSVLAAPPASPPSNGIKPIDLRSAEAFAAGHIPGAVRLDAALLNRKQGSMAGLLPDLATVNVFLSQAGLNPGDHVLAYDAGAATEAARLIWVLHAYGFQQTSWLDGGFAAWQSDGHPTSTDTITPSPGSLSISFSGQNVISADALMNELADTGAVDGALAGALARGNARASTSATILDVRSAAEFEGSDIRSARGGHVPGATHLEWTRVFGPDGRLLEDAALRDLFGAPTGANEQAGVSDQNVIVYCQSHQRSAVTYVVLKHLGVEQVRAIDGAWSSWGNREDTPVETGP